VHNEDPKAFTVSGLRYVGGLDISFIAQEGESAETMDFPGHNASDPNVPDAYAVITVMEYPSLSVSAMLLTSIRKFSRLRQFSVLLPPACALNHTPYSSNCTLYPIVSLIPRNASLS
jgi:hypothetical protein